MHVQGHVCAGVHITTWPQAVLFRPPSGITLARTLIEPVVKLSAEGRCVPLQQARATHKGNGNFLPTKPSNQKAIVNTHTHTLADNNTTSGLRETDSRDPPQRGLLHSQHIYNEKIELPEQRETKSTAGGSDNSFYSSTSGTAQEETSRNNKNCIFTTILVVLMKKNNLTLKHTEYL